MSLLSPTKAPLKRFQAVLVNSAGVTQQVTSGLGSAKINMESCVHGERGQSGRNVCQLPLGI